MAGRRTSSAPGSAARPPRTTRSTPIRERDGRPIGDGVRGPVTGELHTAVCPFVDRRDPQHASWLPKI